MAVTSGAPPGGGAPSPPAVPVLGERYLDALRVAVEVHRHQGRKGTAVPYVSHLLAVSATVLEAGAGEDVAIAALLHDALEDHPDQVSFDGLVARFGPDVARIVEACSDSTVMPKPPWRARKEAYLARLPGEQDDVLLVSLADKLHNVTALRRDLETHGAAAWDRFRAGPAEQLWYHGKLAVLFAERLGAGPAAPFVRDYAATLEVIGRLAGLAS